MAHTFTQILIHCVFAVNHRESLIHPQVRECIEKYITGIVKNNRHKLLAIYCMPDHCHIVIGLDPQQSISDLIRDVKANSSKWINRQKFLHGKFNWQEGYGAFSYSKSQLDTVVKYVLNQPKHHQKKSFKEEYHEILEKFNLEYDENFLFEWID